MGRFFYTLKQAKQHWRALKQFRQSEDRHIRHIVDISPAMLNNKHIKTLVLDFDGVLSPHGAKVPLPEVLAWLDHMLTSFQNNIYILSNKPNSIRRQYFAEKYPEIQFVSGVRKKPYPDGLEKIMALSNTPPQQILLVDDRLLAGVLATMMTGCQAIWVTRAYRQFLGAHWLSECFFATLRYLEQKIF